MLGPPRNPHFIFGFNISVGKLKRPITEATTMRRLTTLAALAAVTIAFSAPAEAARRHHQPTAQAGHQITKFCGDRVCTIQAESTVRSYKAHRAASRAHERRAAALPGRRQAAGAPQAYPWPSYEQADDRRPTGSRRSGLTARSEITTVGYRSALCATATGGLSCGCDTASYFGVRISVRADGKHDLDLASNWGRLKQSPGPCVNCAAWRNGHVMAIIGQEAGGYKVRDFNSGKGKTREYVAARFPGYQFAIPADLKIDYSTYSARRHHVRHHGNRVRYAARRQ